MSWTISGTYVAGCSCAVLCSRPYDGQPRDNTGGTECLGTAVFHVADGNLDDVGLSGVDFAFYNHFPSNLSSGNWKVGVVVGRRGERRAGGRPGAHSVRPGRRAVRPALAVLRRVPGNGAGGGLSHGRGEARLHGRGQDGAVLRAADRPRRRFDKDQERHVEASYGGRPGGGEDRRPGVTHRRVLLADSCRRPRLHLQCDLVPPVLDTPGASSQLRRACWRQPWATTVSLGTP